MNVLTTIDARAGLSQYAEATNGDTDKARPCERHGAFDESFPERANSHNGIRSQQVTRVATIEHGVSTVARGFYGPAVARHSLRGEPGQAVAKPVGQ